MSLMYAIGRRWWCRITPSPSPLCFHTPGSPLLVRRDLLLDIARSAWAGE